ncbi:MAG: hypothetical protein ACRDIY_23715 [Chloroflexota bacterium]
MNVERVTTQDPRIQRAVTELEGLIAKNYPEATFELTEGEDPEGIYLTATVDTDNLTEILGIVDERLVDFQVEQGLPLYVVPVRPIERVMRELRQPRPRRRPRIVIESTVPAPP